MRRLLAIGSIATLMTGCLPAGEAPAEVTGYVPDPSYRAGVGDRPVLYGSEGGTSLERLPLLKDITAYDHFERAYKEFDTQEWADLEEQGWLQWTPTGTRALVLAIQDRAHIGARVAAQVRVLDGPFKDQSVWTPVSYLARFRHVEPPPPE